MDDTRWIRAVRRGDSSAFEALYGAYRRPVYRYACSLSGRTADAEDLLQEAFLGLVRNIDRIDERRPLLPYLLGSVRNRHIDQLRSEAVRYPPSPERTFRSAAEEPPQVEEQERLEQVKSAIDELSPPQGDVVRLKIYGGLTYHAIANELKTPVATIRNRYRAALKRLGELLGRSVTDG